MSEDDPRAEMVNMFLVEKYVNSNPFCTTWGLQGLFEGLKSPVL